MDPKVVVQVLRRSEVLGGLAAPFLTEIAALAVTVRQPAGAHVFYRDDPPDALYVVSTGLLRVVAPLAGGEVTTLSTLGPGAMFGELALFDGRPRSATVVAVTDSVLLRIPRLPLLALVRARPDLAMAIVAGLASRVRVLSQRVEETLTLPARVRLARHLLRLAEGHGGDAGGGVALDAHLPQATLASGLGLSRQTVNRLLGELEAEGLLSVRRARIVLLDREGLARVGGKFDDLP
ncbi:MAG: Crp/Fnr family transcriptional regulator [Myxococcota bacterium]